jgi:hypothetical protein
MVAVMSAQGGSAAVSAGRGTGQASEEIAFPSVDWFRALADAMNRNRARQEQLGYVDCVAEFKVLDGGNGGRGVAYQVTFEEFEATDVREVAAADEARADFALDATLATWRAMIESIAAGSGRPALDQTLNRLSHMGTPIQLRSSDQLRKDMYFRFNQSLQEFVNASAGFRTIFRS